jgi:predicted ATPase
MLTGIELHHFKCFEKLKLPLAPLTLLSGSNAAGKSSVLQSLVLLHQTMREHEWSGQLMLNGGLLQLGTVLDVVDKLTGRHGFRIRLDDDVDPSIAWSLDGARDGMSMDIAGFSVDGREIDKPATFRHLVPVDCYDLAGSVPTRLRDLTYITAERLGPREVYALEDKETTRVVGPRGEHAVSVLYRGRDEIVDDGRVLADVPPTRLKQIEARMRQFFPGAGLEVQPVARANAVTLGLRTSDRTDFHRPVHVGFGLTQVLPIVVAAVSLAKGDILLVENPEVHLHPAGQALMGGFLAEIAAAGVQVIIETHSDHVLNGIRRAVRSKVISPEQTVLHFFRPRGDDLDQVVSPALDIMGNVDVWPDGFFDQFDKDMNHFAGWGD